MKSEYFESRASWLAARNGKITGTKLKDVIIKRKGAGPKVGFYELIAERLMVEDGIDLGPMERGSYLEDEAMQSFIEDTKKEVNTDLVMWSRDDNENIALSPDGVISKTEAVETKCLGSARHIEAYLTKKIPKDYEEQVLQYFIVNDDLQKLYVVFFDPRMITKDYFYLTVDRKDVAKKASEYLDFQVATLKEIDKIVAELTDF